jgi:hypothetical protein
MIAMIKTLVAANQYFFEFPRTNEPEKQHLLQEHDKYLVSYMIILFNKGTSH